MQVLLTAEQIDANIEALVTARKIEGSTEKMIRTDYESYLLGCTEAGEAIVAYWQAAEDAEVISKVRAQFSRASKAAHKDLDVNVGKGAKVEDGAIVLAASRQGKRKLLQEIGKAFDESDLSTADLKKLAEMLKAAAAEMTVTV